MAVEVKEETAKMRFSDGCFFIMVCPFFIPATGTSIKILALSLKACRGAAYETGLGGGTAQNIVEARGVRGAAIVPRSPVDGRNRALLSIGAA